MLKLNLGSGDRPLGGYLNIDIRPQAPGVQIVHDLDNFPWPFESNSVDEVVMDNCLEHLIDCNRAMKEIHRILKPGGKAKIIVPHFTWQLAYTDPTHRHFFAYNTFFYYSGKKGNLDIRFSSCKARIIFGKSLSLWNYILEPIFNMFPNVYEQSPLRIFPAVCIVAILFK